MLRYFYLLSLLICINFSFCYEYSSDTDSNVRSIGRINDHRKNLQHKKHRKRHDYDEYDKDPVAEIDVASFINSAEDDAISGNDPYNLHYKNIRDEKHNNNYGSLTDDISNSNEDYSDMETENLQETSHYDVKLNPLSENRVISEKFPHGFDKNIQDNLGENVVDRNNRHHAEKKCVLRNFKLPFFSHNKSTIAKAKNDKKRKIHGFHDPRQGNVNRKDSHENLSKHGKAGGNLNLYKRNKIKKRSYIERLCPACRRKFIISKTSRSQKKGNNILKTMYDLRRKDLDINGRKQIYKDDLDTIMNEEATSNEKVTLENHMSGRRKRDDDNRNVERQKELEYLEKRVDSVTVNKPTYNTIKY